LAQRLEGVRQSHLRALLTHRLCARGSVVPRDRRQVSFRSAQASSAPKALLLPEIDHGQAIALAVLRDQLCPGIRSVRSKLCIESPALAETFRTLNVIVAAKLDLPNP
ncbi:unnamed protein product, partial [Chrysoparadoxa australica]